MHQAEVRQQLLEVNRGDPFRRFYLDDNASVDQHVYAVGALDRMAAESQIQVNLPLDQQAVFRKLDLEHPLVCRFEQARSNLSMNSHGAIHNHRDNLFEMHVSPFPFLRDIRVKISVVVRGKRIAGCARFRGRRLSEA